MVEMENAEQIQAEAAKFGGKLPPELQAQFQEEMERQISLRATEFIEEMFVEEQQAMSGQGQDPLVGLKQQELQIKAQDIQRKAQNDAARIDIDMQKMQQTEDLTKEKIQSNEDIAQLRANVNLNKQNDKRDS
jgi:exonuclease I